MIEIETPIYRMTGNLEGFGASELGEHELERLLVKNPSGEDVQKVWYFYGKEMYEGYGYAVVLLKSGVYQLWDLGHCSYYSAGEHYNFTVFYSLRSGNFTNKTPKAFQNFVLSNQ